MANHIKEALRITRFWVGEDLLTKKEKFTKESGKKECLMAKESSIQKSLDYWGISSKDN